MRESRCHVGGSGGFPKDVAVTVPQRAKPLIGKLSDGRWAECVTRPLERRARPADRVHGDAYQFYYGAPSFFDSVSTYRETSTDSPATCPRHAGAIGAEEPAPALQALTISRRLDQAAAGEGAIVRTPACPPSRCTCRAGPIIWMRSRSARRGESDKLGSAPQSVDSINVRQRRQPRSRHPITISISGPG